MLSKYKSIVEKNAEGVASYLYWISPNTLTLLGIIPQALFFYFMWHQQFLAAVIALACSFLDILDGLVARKFNKVSAFGGLLDSTLDRIADFLIISGFYVADLISLPLASCLLLITFLISYVRSRAELASENKIKFDMGLIERPERIIYLLIVLLIKVFFPSTTIIPLLVIILTLLSIVTLMQRLIYAYKKL